MPATAKIETNCKAKITLRWQELVRD